MNTLQKRENHADSRKLYTDNSKKNRTTLSNVQ